MKPTDSKFKELIARLQTGELTRAQAAQAYEINPGTLNVWISRSGLADTIPNLQGKVGTAGAMAIKDPDKVAALEAAVSKVLSGESSARAISLANPELSANTISAWVRKAKKKAGIPVPKRTNRYGNAANFAK